MRDTASRVHTEPRTFQRKGGRERAAPGEDRVTGPLGQQGWTDGGGDGWTEEGADRQRRRHRLERWKLKAKAKKNPQKMVLLPSTGDKGI